MTHLGKKSKEEHVQKHRVEERGARADERFDHHLHRWNTADGPQRAQDTEYSQNRNLGGRSRGVGRVSLKWMGHAN